MFMALLPAFGNRERLKKLKAMRTNRPMCVLAILRTEKWNPHRTMLKVSAISSIWQDLKLVLQRFRLTIEKFSGSSKILKAAKGPAIELHRLRAASLHNPSLLRTPKNGAGSDFG